MKKMNRDLQIDRKWMKKDRYRQIDLNEQRQKNKQTKN